MNKGQQTPSQQPPGKEQAMDPKPKSRPNSNQAKKLEGQVALITGADSGIGRATARLFAQHGADVVIVYKDQDDDATETKAMVEETGKHALLIAGDVGDKSFCEQAVKKTLSEYGRLDVLVNNAAEQHPQEDVTNISEDQLLNTFRTNLFSQFFMVQAALPHMQEGARIINTASVTAYRGSSHLLDYSSTKGAIVAFTRSLSAQLAEKKIRVNAVAPGPVWTPLIVSTFPKEEADHFGEDTPLGRAGQPAEIAPSFLFLATDDSSYMTGQVLHPNGGEIINS